MYFQSLVLIFIGAYVYEHRMNNSSYSWNECIHIIFACFIYSCTKVGLAVGDVDSRLKTAFENRIELQVNSV